MGVLAEEVPFSHHVNSTIVCRLSGRIMDEDNMPMAFPNGYVYSREVSLGNVLAELNYFIVRSPFVAGAGGYGRKKGWDGHMSAVLFNLRVHSTAESLYLMTCIVTYYLW